MRGKPRIPLGVPRSLPHRPIIRHQRSPSGDPIAYTRRRIWGTTSYNASQSLEGASDHCDVVIFNAFIWQVEGFFSPFPRGITQRLSFAKKDNIIGDGGERKSQVGGRTEWNVHRTLTKSNPILTQ